tara:strand:+ start:10576 stop:10797 length:222 start_codon:yes stop_codon:yes gene_type:complete
MMNQQIFNSVELGCIIRKARKAQGLTQEDLSGMTGTGIRFISELERGKQTAQIGKVISVISTLGLVMSISSEW